MNTVVAWCVVFFSRHPLSILGEIDSEDLRIGPERNVMRISSARMLKVCADMPSMSMHDAHCGRTNVAFMKVDYVRRSASCPLYTLA